MTYDHWEYCREATVNSIIITKTFSTFCSGPGPTKKDFYFTNKYDKYIAFNAGSIFLITENKDNVMSFLTLNNNFKKVFWIYQESLRWKTDMFYILSK